MIAPCFRRFALVFIVAFALPHLPAGLPAADVQPERLQCEYLSDPLGIDVVRPRLSWLLTADADARGQRQTAYQILVADRPAVLMRDEGNCWDSGQIASDETTQVEYAGAPLRSRATYWWKVRVWDAAGEPSDWSKPARWSVGPLGKNDWRAQWISSPQKAADTSKALPLPWLRKTFTLNKPPNAATAYVTAMGYFELFVNGRKVGDDVLVPAVADFSKRALYLTYDISEYLVPGENCVALWLGRGWYCRGIPGVIHDSPLVMAELDITTADGESIVVGTDATWKTHPSSISPRGGVNYERHRGVLVDQNRDVAGWNTVGLDDASWTPAAVFEPELPTIAAEMVAPNRIQQVIKPVGVKELSPGVYLVDMGRLMVGWFALGVDARPGQTIACDYIEHIAPDGTMTTYKQRDEYHLVHAGPTTLRTRFDYHAFRWVKVIGLDGPPDLERISGEMITTDIARAGRFECSNDLLNRIYETVVWTHRCLSLGGYVVDCPHRERLGYGGDCHATMESALGNFDAGAFYTKWLADWRAAQDDEGNLPHVCPAFTSGGGGPAWSGICVTLPWQVYLRYGDRRALEQSYPQIQKWIAFLDTKCKDNILEPYGHATWGFLGDWVPPGRGQNAGQRVDDHSTLFFNNVYRLRNVQLAARIADVLKRGDDAAAYRAKAQSIAQDVHQRFYDADRKTYANGEQPYLAMPLLTKLTPEPLRTHILESLADDILITHQGHLNSGIHGTYYLIKALTQENRHDLIYSIVSQTTYPGWGHMLANDATTIWEQWDSRHSHCHSSFLSIGAWFLEGVGGIVRDEASPGFKHVILRPHMVGDLTFARAEYDSIHGPIRSDWRIDEGTFEWTIEVPPGTTATAYVPAADADAVRESNRPAAEAPGVTFLRTDADRAVFALGSGRYHFQSTP